MQLSLVSTYVLSLRAKMPCVIVQRNAMAVARHQNAVAGPTYRERLEADPEGEASKETLDEIFVRVGRSCSKRKPSKARRPGILSLLDYR